MSIPSKHRPTGPSNSASQPESALRKILKDAPQNLWLDTVRRARFATHNSLVAWMLDQPECDFAVAVHAFYRSNPAQHLDAPKALPARPNADEIFAQCLINWDTGSYRTHRLKVEECDAPLRQISRLHQKVIARPRGSLPFHIPQRFLEPKGGIPLELPEHMNPENAPDLWKIYTAAGLTVPNTAPGLPRKFAEIMHKIFLR